MSNYYTKEQIDAQATVVGSRIKDRTSETAIVALLDTANDKNLITDAERALIATIEPSKYKGVHANLAALTTAHPAPGAGASATLAVTGGDDTEAIWDVGEAKWIDTGDASGNETAATVLTKLLQNPNTENFTTTLKNKLDALVAAPDISAFTAALDAALA